MKRTSFMWRGPADRSLVALLLAVGAVDRFIVLLRFGFRHIGIDDALIQQMAIEYGHGIFREPFLHGQNYNPMLEALLAAPFVRAGSAPWLVLPVVTSVLALLPFWSLAIWCIRKRFGNAALVFAATPLLLPVEWSLITTQSRGFVHGIALLAFVPWAMDLSRPWFRHLLVNMILAAALWCNPNVLPLVVGIVVWSLWKYGRALIYWATGIAAAAALAGVHWASQAYYSDHPERLVHPLTTADLAFSSERIAIGLGQLNAHFMHQLPFHAGAAFLVPLLLLSTIVVLWRRKDRSASIAFIGIGLTMILALGVLKVHEGCASVFFPLSRMYLALPLILGACLALLFASAQRARWMLPVGGALLLGWVLIKAIRIDAIVETELGDQSCAYVREEPIDAVRHRCLLLNEIGRRYRADVIVPIRWPGIRVDHQEHFTAHLACYACPVLVDFMPVYGAGYDRRFWLKERYDGPLIDRVLFVGGDPLAWARAAQEHPGIRRIPVAGEELHMVELNSERIEEAITSMGVDDELGR